jgi:hypothetical protein
MDDCRVKDLNWKNGNGRYKTDDSQGVSGGFGWQVRSTSRQALCCLQMCVSAEADWRDMDKDRNEM